MDDPYALFDGVSFDDGEVVVEDGNDNRPSIYVEGDKVIFRASAFGNCIKELAGIRAGIVPAPWPAKFRKKFADGHRGEDVIIGMLEAEGWTITRRQEEINWEILPGLVIRGHIDGVAIWTGDDFLHPELGWVRRGDRFIFDAKTTSKKYGISPTLQVKYDWQMSIYGHALDVDRGLIGVGTKDEASGDVVSTDTHTMDTLPFSVAQIKARLAKINSLAKRCMDAPDRDVAVLNLECDTENRYPCGLYRFHNDEKPVTVRSNTSSDEIFDGLMEEYEAAKQDEAEAKALKEDAKERLVKHLGGKVAKVTENWSLDWTGTGTQKQLDKKALAKFLAAHEKTIEEFEGTVSREKSIKVDRVAG